MFVFVGNGSNGPLSGNPGRFIQSHYSIMLQIYVLYGSSHQEDVTAASSKLKSFLSTWNPPFL